jgi:peptide chain release factor subunit 1
MNPSTDTPSVLILTPVKDAARYLDGYWQALDRLAYPPQAISLGLLESDSRDGTYDMLRTSFAARTKPFANADLWKTDFGFHLPADVPRWSYPFQLQRRRVLARARNHLLSRALGDQDWVLWLDVDVVEYPADLLQRMMATGRSIVHAHCVQDYGGPTFDRNAWREHGRVHMDDLRGGPDLVRLDSVGGTVLLVRADIHRDGLIFPPFPYGKGNPTVRQPGPWGPQMVGEIETEGLGIMAIDMGHQCWGMPNLEVLHARD